MCDKCDPRRKAYLDRLGLPADDPERRRHRHSPADLDPSCTVESCGGFTAGPRMKGRDKALRSAASRRAAARRPSVVDPVTRKRRPLRDDERLLILTIDGVPAADYAKHRREVKRLNAIIGSGALEAVGPPEPVTTLSVVTRGPSYPTEHVGDDRPAPSAPLRSRMSEVS